MTPTTLLKWLKAYGVAHTAGGSSINANVNHRTGTFSALQAVGDGGSGEIAVSTDTPQKLVVYDSSGDPLETPIMPAIRVGYIHNSYTVSLTASSEEALLLGETTGATIFNSRYGDIGFFDATDEQGITIPTNWPSSIVVARFHSDSLFVNAASAVNIDFEWKYDYNGGTDILSGVSLSMQNNQAVTYSEGGTGSLVQAAAPVLIMGILTSTSPGGKTIGISATADVNCTMHFGTSFLEIMCVPYP